LFFFFTRSTSEAGVWSTAKLSEARDLLAATSVNNLALFGGGDASSGVSSVIDIYNSTSNIWSTAKLSEARF